MTEEQRQNDSAGMPPETGGKKYDEKDEKERREDQEKHNEKEEKETTQQDPLSRIMWAIFLIAAGLILLAQTQGYITWDQFGGFWSLLFLTIGVFTLAEVLLRLLLPAYRRPVAGQLVTGIVFLILGLGGIIGLEFSGAIILIALGLAILVGGLTRGRF
jgi:cation transport ATPase